ncbi:hypothetical protein OSB04_031250 [Centaurea solstitialis]|uniref:Ionotropic glutamate receptor C-terminal domain-containing protein n=1 Tax=Centaurea solstitialis TaxID=347529 RepID=A0AA38VXE8_9ASTR|nr:hypothetical protein OSB04_031250 [Centaurea solstitialis]
MHNSKSYLILSLVAFWLPCFLLQASVAIGSLNMPPELVRNETGFTRIGVILGQTSRPGKEAKVSIEIAIQEFNIKANRSSVLYLQNSLNKPSRAAFAAKELLDENGVQAILGGQTWEEASAIAEVINEADHDEIPLFLSLADSTHSTNQWPFLVQAVPSQSTQMNAVAAVLLSWGIRRVTLIYETLHLSSTSSSIISHLSQAFQQTGCELTLILPLSSGSSFLNKELEVLKRQKRRVFIMHTSLELGIRLFQTAKKMQMTGDGYLWIATNEITDLFHSINSTVISSLKGMVGVKSYFPENTPEFQDFRKRFRQKFRSDYMEEEQDEPGIFAMQGYNAVKFLEKDSAENLHHWRPIPATIVEIVSVIGKGYHSVYWTEGLGFSETVDDINGATTYAHSMDNMGQALWPVKPSYARKRHRNLAESSKNQIRVGVPNGSLFEQFVKVKFDLEKNEHAFDGFVIGLFDEIMKKINQPFKYELFNGSYGDLIKEIPKNKFDAVAGDVTILSERHEFADFTQPFTESGLQMIVPVRYRLSNQAWLFLKPFTAEMWWLIAVITIYNGFIIWLIERKHCEDEDDVITQIGIVFWLAFTTLFTLRGDRLHSNLSRMAMVMWLFVALIITQSYTASLSSMLTAQRLEPAIESVEHLRNMNATVGYCNGEFIRDYLRDILHFDNVSINSYNSTHQYAEALNNGEIKAIFLDVPSTKVFLAQYCKSFIRTRETFKVGGFGFAFRKGFNLSDANEALMNVTENGKLKELEDRFLNSAKCVDDESSTDKDTRLSTHSFWVLFTLTGGTSTVALAIYIILGVREFKKSTQEHTSFINLMSAFIKYWQNHARRSSKVDSVDSNGHVRNADQWTQDDTDENIDDLVKASCMLTFENVIVENYQESKKRIYRNLIQMHKFKSYLILSLVAFLLPCFLLTAGSLDVSPEVRNEAGIARIGVILGQTSRSGKEAKVSIEIAIQDFKIETNRSLVLYLKNSQNKPSRAVIAAKELIDEHGVSAILGGHTWEEASAIAEVISEADHDIPVFLSLADTTPLQASDQWPFLVQAVPTQSTQMNAVAAILQSWGIRQVTLIYETSHLASSSASIISHLSQAFQQTGCELAHSLPLASGSSFLNKELEVLKRQKRRVFIIHTSLELGIRLFQTAKKMQMTGDGYLWIATNEITDLFHSINTTVISSLKGMVGVKSYFPENTPDFQDFRQRFRQKFHSDYPEEEQDEPGIFAMQGYNAMKLLEKHSPENLHHWRPIPATIVEIVSVIGKGYHSVYWTKGLGFSETVDDINGATTYTHSVDNMGQALWPVKPSYSRRRHRNLAESSKNRIRVGVPSKSLFKQFVKVDSEGNSTKFTGFVIAVFEEMMNNMSQSYDYESFDGSYDELIEEIWKKKFDAVAGDVTILAKRHEFADFTQPYTESGLEMIVPVRSRISNKAWLFLKPFTPEMYWLIAAITI